jgi:hypothetical protein
MDLSCKPKQQPDYRLEELDDELLLYHPSRTVLMYCNPSASLIWHLCDGQRTVAGIVELLSAAYDQPSDTLTAEITTTLSQFHQHGAVTYVGQTSG